MRGWIVVGLLVVLMPGIILGIVRDLLMIMWAALPWYAQMGIALLGVLAVLAVIRMVLWAVMGRSTIRRR